MSGIMCRRLLGFFSRFYDFPREVLRLAEPPESVRESRRFTVNNLFSFLSFFHRHFGRRHIYAGVYSVQEIQLNTFSRIFLDFDNNEGAEAIVSDVLEFYDKIVSAFGGSPLLLFSGNKGFHIYIFFPAHIFYNLSRAVRRLVEYLEPPPCLDAHVLGDRRRVARIPFSLHLKTNKLCVPLINGELEYYSDLSELPEHIFNASWSNSDIDWSEFDILEPESRIEVSNVRITDEYLDKLMQLAPRIVDGRHRILFAIVVPALVHRGLSREEIHAWCREFIYRTGKEYEEYRRGVDYEIDRVLRDGWRPWRMRTFLMRNLDLALAYAYSGAQESGEESDSE